MFGCCPRHQVKMLVPDRAEPMTNIGASDSVMFVKSIVEHAGERRR